jgi:hypothetical protein
MLKAVKFWFVVLFYMIVFCSFHNWFSQFVFTIGYPGPEQQHSQHDMDR